jgi:prepilin-type N-terminal cleavage/methylation domain-containing protein
LFIVTTGVRAATPRRSGRALSRGFTLTELMAVVAIMGVLAVIAVSAFTRRAYSSSVSHAQIVLKAIGAAEERYRSLNQVYLDVSRDSISAANQGWYPTATIPSGKKVLFEEPTHPDYNPAGRRGWRYLNPSVTQPVGFSFKVNAGLPSTAIGTVALAAPGLAFSANAGTEPWYVAQARADADGDGTYCALVATSFMPEVRWVNEGE